MANPTYFTVVADFKSVVVDLDTDVDADPQLGPVTAKVTFTPVLANGDVILASQASPRPTVFVPAPIVARIDTDGRLKLRVAPDGDRDDFATRAAFPSVGSTAKVYFAIDAQTFYRWTGSSYVETYPYAPVRLLADTALLGLASDLYYRVTFSEVIFNGGPGYINSFTFKAQTSDVELNLVNVARVPGQPAVGTTKGDKGDRGYSFVGLAPAGDGSSVVGLIETATGVVPAGEPIPISLAYNSTVTHGTAPLTARPPVSVAVIWIGSVEPVYAINGDVWLDTNGSTPSITTTVLSSLNQYAQTSQTIIASGTVPIVWSVSAGTLPAGLSLSTEGNLYGSPTSTGSYDFTVKALNAFGEATRQLTGTLGSAIGPTINTTSLGTVTAGTSFSLTLSSSGSVPITYAVQSGSLPTGLALNATTGVISGTASAIGSYTFTIRATNAAGYDDQAFTGTVAGVAPTITTNSLSALYRAFSTSQTLAATGSASITYGVQSGSLPTGLSLNGTTGLISGTPTTVAAYSFTIRATNSYGTNDKAFTGSVLESTPTIVETSLSAMEPSVAFAQTLTLSAGGPTVTWSVLSGTLPAGISLNSSTGLISGTPTTAGSYTFTIRATNGTNSDDQLFTGSVTRPIYFDAVGSGGNAGTTATLTTASGTHTATAGTTVLVYCSYANTSANSTVSATYGGVAMTRVGSTYNVGFSGFAQSYGALFKLDNAPAGSKSVIVTTGVGSLIRFESVSYVGVSTVGTLQTSNQSTTSLSQIVTSASYHLISQCFFSTSAPFDSVTSYNKTARVNKNSGSPWSTMCVGETAGASSATFTGTITTRQLPNCVGAMAVDLS